MAPIFSNCNLIRGCVGHGAHSFFLLLRIVRLLVLQRLRGSRAWPPRPGLSSYRSLCSHAPERRACLSRWRRVPAVRGGGTAMQNAEALAARRRTRTTLRES